MLPYVIVFIILFTVVYLVYSFIFDDMLKKEKYAKISELGFLVRVNNLDKKKMDYKKCLHGVSAVNACIISFVSIMMMVIKVHYMFRLLIAFVMLMILIYGSYTLYGKYLYKKWGKKDGK